MVLPDTSIWVDFSRRGVRGRAADMPTLLDAGEVATCAAAAAGLLAAANGEVGPETLVEVERTLALIRGLGTLACRG